MRYRYIERYTEKSERGGGVEGERERKSRKEGR